MTRRWYVDSRISSSSPFTFSYIRSDSPWVGDGAGSASRDLGLAQASNGLLGARLHRNESGSAVILPAATDAATVAVVLSGEVMFGSKQEVEPASLGPLGFTYMGPGSEDHLSLTPGTKIFLLTLSAQEKPMATNIPGLELSSAVEGDSESLWVKGGLRSFFEYRYLPTRELTDGALGLLLSRVVEGCPPGGTGFHYHTSSQIFYVLSGWVVLPVEGHGVLRVSADEAVCLPAGPNGRHNVTDYSDDYSLIELFVPASPETITTDPPPEFVG